MLIKMKMLSSWKEIYWDGEYLWIKGPMTISQELWKKYKNHKGD
jgi:hypothetical protein